uniref:Uncharacterized protein n=1 Tax=uncultured bacterium 162 TaxID=698381 RepID=E3T756_9BACT|nr:hypothetical protein [uncultured bacterium 162]
MYPFLSQMGQVRRSSDAPSDEKPIVLTDGTDLCAVLGLLA